MASHLGVVRATRKTSRQSAAIFNSRLGADRIRDYVEFLYASENCTLRERMAWARDKKKNPYLAQFGTLNGGSWEGEIICGHNPYLRARLVDDFNVEVQAEDNEKATWKERPKPSIH